MNLRRSTDRVPPPSRSAPWQVSYLGVTVEHPALLAALALWARMAAKGGRG